MDPKTLNALVHDREAAAYDERFAISYDGSIGRVVERDLARVPGAGDLGARRALDFCCGTGFAAIGMAAADIAGEVHGCDLSQAMLDHAQDNADAAGVQIHLTLCDGEGLPYRDGSFDLVVARGALHHLPSPVDALRELRRVLAPGGRVLVLAEPTPSGERQVAAIVGNLARGVEWLRRTLGRPVDEEHHNWELASMAANLHTFEAADIAKLAAEAGFDDITTSTQWWAWVLTLGLNYYLSGEFRFVERAWPVKKLRYLMVAAANAADRLGVERLIPERHRHTVVATLR